MEKRWRRSSDGIGLRAAVAVCVLSFIAGAAYTQADRTAGIRGSSLVARGAPEVGQTGQTSPTGRTANFPAGEWQTVRMRVTAYCPCSKCCGDSADGITANGHRIRRGDAFVAADRRYPFGTEMVIPGYNDGQSVKVLDRGGAIRGEKLDVFFHSHQVALEWGVQYLDVKMRSN